MNRGAWWATVLAAAESEMTKQLPHKHKPGLLVSTTCLPGSLCSWVEAESYAFWKNHTSFCTLMISKIWGYVFLKIDLGIESFFSFYLHPYKMRE